ncbi:MAG: DUF167 domain-containing protein [Thermocrispum agreste]|uniref:UPF0235 protein DIU77_018370 n=1 Tax=Thermocrispum agreste TaxID=37925 RepID=A0ABD6FJJ8_9PSEU
MTSSVRFAVRVKPNAKRNHVGGARGDALVVAVTAPAVDGKANEAVTKALAAAFDVRRQHVHIVTGLRGRDKVVELDPAPPEAERRLAELLLDERR